MDDRFGTDHGIKAASRARIQPVDEYVDVAAKGAGLVPDAGAELRPGDDRRVQDRSQKCCLTANRNDELALTVGQLS